MRLAYSQLAAGELVDYLLYVAKQSPQAAAEQEAGLRSLLEALARRDFDGPSTILRNGEMVQS